MDTIRLFADTMDFSYHGGTGWSTLKFLFYQFSDVFSDFWGCIDDAEIKSLIVWVLHLSASDFKENFSPRAFSLLVALSSTQRAVEVSSLLLNFNDSFIDIQSEFEGYSALQVLICKTAWHNDISFGLNLMLNKGADLHFVGYERLLSVKRETPTSLAMYSSFGFLKWRDALLRLSINLESFVEDEVQHSPLRDAGWDNDSLLALFHCKIQPGHIPSWSDCCDDCPNTIWYIWVEISWQEWLNRFKQKSNAKITSGDESSGAESDRSDGEIREQNFSSLEVRETVLNEFSDEEESFDETETETFDAYFGGETGFVCMGCYLKRQGYDPVILPHIDPY
ncbi:hypothetical protein MMC22_006424 [Lobaria immixta]|nr:hypothetical protein [Lobaria immixta]